MPSGIIAHRETGYATACPDSLDIDRIIRLAAGAPAPTPAPTPVVNEEEMSRVIKGDQKPAVFELRGDLRRWLTIQAEVNFLISKSVEKALEVWPQYIVDRIPVLERVPESLAGTQIQSYEQPVYRGLLAPVVPKILMGEAAEEARDWPGPVEAEFPY